ncbi:MAG TPA: hypothetical protein VG962_09380 [Steroidobacteraceae bacterium]|nr:hypothetical protein [Steroidobacteraceae bacterium]
MGSGVGYVFFYFSRRRLQDLNVPGYIARILAFPFIGVMLLPYLLFTPAPRIPNDFGEPKEQSGFLKLCAAFFVFFMALVLVPYVTILYQRR